MQSKNNIRNVTLDLLRVLAATFVFLYHLEIPYMGFGFLGVDLFFVLSGYLMVLTTFDDIKRGKYEISKFLFRRINRIFPSLVLVLCIFGLVSSQYYFGIDREQLVGSMNASVLSYANIFFWLETGYFKPEVKFVPFIHLWSISIEVQFYLIVSIFFKLCCLIERRLAISLVTIVTVVGLIIGFYGSLIAPSASFYLLPTRLWEFGAGMLAAYFTLMQQKSKVPSLWFLLGIPSIGVIVGSYLGMMSPFFQQVHVVAFVVAVILNDPGQRVRSERVKGFIGKLALLSFAFYLVHQPTIVTLRFYEMSFAHFVALSFFLSYLLAVLVDRLAGAVGSIYGQGWPRKVSYFALLLLFPIFTSAYISKSAENRESKDARLSQISESIKDDGDVAVRECIFWSPNVAGIDVFKLKRCFDKRAGARKILVVGDSHAGNLFRALGQAVADEILVGITAGGCRIVDIDSKNCDLKGLKKFSELKNFDVLIYKQAGFHYFESLDGDRAGRSVFGSPTVERLIVQKDQFREISEFFINLGHPRVVHAGPWIEPHVPRQLIVGAAVDCEEPPKTWVSSRWDIAFLELDRQSANFWKNADKVKHWSLLETVPEFSPPTLHNCASVFWRDGDHLSWGGENYFGPKLLLALSDLKW